MLAKERDRHLNTSPSLTTAGLARCQVIWEQSQN
jgi:hypothetical protein